MSDITLAISIMVSMLAILIVSVGGCILAVQIMDEQKHKSKLIRRFLAFFDIH